MASKNGYIGQTGNKNRYNTKSKGGNNTTSVKELETLQFRNPGPRFMANFDPERSGREMRKVQRKIYTEKRKKGQVYDKNGLLLDDSRDICDCLEEQCPGCHFPCTNCGSGKCGTHCRNSRRWYDESIEIEGRNETIKFPDPQPQS